MTSNQCSACGATFNQCSACGATFKLSELVESYADGVRHSRPERCVEHLSEEVERLNTVAFQAQNAAIDLAQQVVRLWRWIDRMASGEVTTEAGLSVLTHHPDAPEWVTRTRTTIETPAERKP